MKTTLRITDSAEKAQKRLAARLLSKRELAACGRTIDNWLAQNRIPRLRLSNRLTRSNLPKVEAALARYEVREIGRRLP